MAATQPCLFRRPYRIGIRDWALKATTACLLAPHRVLHRGTRAPPHHLLQVATFRGLLDKYVMSLFSTPWMLRRELTQHVWQDARSRRRLWKLARCRG